MPSNPESDTPPPAPLPAALKVLLRPLVRLMVAHGVTLPTMVGMLKELYVEVAARHFRLGGREASDSRVSLLTGVHRKDVRAIRERARPVSLPRGGGLGATVLGRWLGDPALARPGGRPLPISRARFDELVASVSTDVRPRTVLDELLRLGLVAWDETADELRLLADAYVPTAVQAGAAGEEALRFFRDNLHDHIAAATANLLAGPGERRFLERAVFYNRLRAEDVERLEQEARTLGLAALRHLNSLALERQQAARGAPEATERFRFGIFFFRETSPGEAPPDTPGETR
ncbi:DUF6502 family protein [Falsiroseomonas sp. HW251]|uniref:DUF6502 family protein n=1 Tax=Falsiroseomonas sp. HW251 TaxID=3390998 RepID=UPI003D315C3D